MTPNEHLLEAFVAALHIAPEDVVDDLQYNSIPSWDSAAHMVLIAELEDRFNVMLDTDDIIDMSSVAKARLILTKYGVDFS